MNCKGSLVEEWNLSGPILHELEDIFKIGLLFRWVSCSFSRKCLGNVPTCCLHWKRMLETDHQCWAHFKSTVVLPYV